MAIASFPFGGLLVVDRWLVLSVNNMQLLCYVFL
jgi:hypothetical protein